MITRVDTIKLVAGALLGFSLLIVVMLLTGSPVQAACSTLPTGKGTVAMSLSVPSSGSYRVWARMLAPSAGVNGFYLQIPDANACQVTMGDAVIPTGAWTWVDYQNGTTSNKVNVTLAAGAHQVNLAGLDDGVQIDKILLLSDSACTPSGDGSNCTSAAAGSTPAPASSGGGGSTPTSTPVAIPVSGISNAKCSIDGKTVDCAAVDTKKLSDGQHTVTVTGTDENGQPVKKTTTINVKNKVSLKDQIIAGVQKFRWPLLGLVIILIGVPAAWILVRRFRRPQIISPVTAPTTPPSNVVYPDKPGGPITP